MDKVEFWQDVTGYEGLYQVSNLGRVYSLERKKTRQRGSIVEVMTFKPFMKKQQTKTDGYLTTGLTDQTGKKKTVSVHRLVALMFIENPENKPEVNHKNGNKTDNKVNNLEWNTPTENSQHAYDTGLKKGAKGETNNKSVLTETDVLEIRKLYKLGGETQLTLCNKFKVSKSTIKHILKRRTWKHI